MSDQVLSGEKKIQVENSAGVAVKTDDGTAACPTQGKGWFKGYLGMAISCGAPLLVFAAIAFLGVSLGALASGVLSLVALLACLVGMFLMMRLTNKNEEK